MWNRAAIVASVLAGVLSLTSCSTPIGTKANSTREFLTNAVSQEHFDWRVNSGPDFDVFYGTQSKSESAGIGIYFGSFPDFHPGKDAKIVKGKLGACPVVWYETVTESTPKFRRAAVIGYSVNGRGQKIHIWVYGATQAEMLAMADYAAGLKLFAKPLN